MGEYEVFRIIQVDRQFGVETVEFTGEPIYWKDIKDILDRVPEKMSLSQTMN